MHWDPVVANLRHEFQCVVVNYSHFYMARSAITFTEQVALLSLWIRENFPSQKVSVVGMSYGAALSWGIGVKNPELIDKAVFINPMPPAPAQYFAMRTMKFFFSLPLGRKITFLFLSTYFGKNFLVKCAQIFRLQTKREASRLGSIHGKKKIFVGHLFNNFAWILKGENWSAWKEEISKKWNHSSLLIFDDQDPLFAKPCFSEFHDLIKPDDKFVTSGAGHISTQGLPNLISRTISLFLNRETKRKTA